jgi:hypothetical protein
MKAWHILFGVLAAIVVGLFVIYPPHPSSSPTSTPIVNNSAELTDGTYCYVRDQKAIPEAPYSVSETIKIYVTGSDVNGTKTGTQSGPDMTNGYAGSLIGTRDANHLTLVFDYTIEGSSNREQELYDWTPTELHKLRYTLKESGTMLVPDLSTTPQTIIYTSIPCTD